MNYAQFKLQQLDIELSSWGGRREGAGRKRAPGRGVVPHRRREVHRARHPVHVTLRARLGLPSLREEALFRGLRRHIGAANRSARLRNVFRVVHFSVQRDHIHLIVEAHDQSALARGVQGLAIRLARRTNELLAIRGKFWGDRFHSRELTSPRAVRNAIVYVLMNVKKHERTSVRVDRLTSAPWFDGFARPISFPDEELEPPIRSPRTWLGGVGWRRHGLVRLDERPS